MSRLGAEWYSLPVLFENGKWTTLKALFKCNTQSALQWAYDSSIHTQMTMQGAVLTIRSNLVFSVLQKDTLDHQPCK